MIRPMFPPSSQRPLEYVVREIGLVAVACPPLEPNEPHSLVHGGSIEGDMIARMSHTHPLFKVDNGAVFKLIKNSVRGTAIAASIAPFHSQWPWDFHGNSS